MKKNEYMYTHTCTEIHMHIYICTCTLFPSDRSTDKENLQQEKYHTVFHINLYCIFRWIKLNSISVDILSSIVNVLNFYPKLEHCLHRKISA